MSQIQVDSIYNKEATGSPSFPLGANVTGVITATTFKGGAEITSGTISATSVTAASGTFNGPVTIGGTLTYEDVTNIDSVGVITARNGINVSGGTGTFAGDINANGNIVGDNSTNISGVSSVTATNFYGNGASLSGIEAAPTFQATASGAIANGKSVVLNSDATVSAAATTLIPEAFGTQATLQDSSYTDACMGTVWISDTQFVTSYMRENDDYKMFLAVGTVNGTTITYGTAVDFPGPVVRVYSSDITWDSSLNVGIVYVQDNFNAESKIFTFTVSGSTITFTHTNYNALLGSAANCVSIASNNKGGICILRIFNNGVQYYYAGTVSATGSVTVGSSAGGNGGWDTSVTTNQNRKTCKVVYNPDRDNFGMFVQGTSGNSGRIYVVLATIAGTSLNAGSFVGLYNSTVDPGAALTYNSDKKCFCVVYREYNGNQTRLRTWTVDSNNVLNCVDGTDMQVTSGASNASIDYFGVDYNPGTKNVYVNIDRSAGMSVCEVEFASTSSITPGTVTTLFSGNRSRASSMAANNTVGKVYFNTADTATPYDVLSKVMQAEIINTNVTANNFLGFSAAAYTNGQTVTIKTVGNVDANQTGLTPATKYYLTRGGDLSLTADDPSVYAGLALNSTSIAVKFPV